MRIGRRHIGSSQPPADGFMGLLSEQISSCLESSRNQVLQNVADILTELCVECSNQTRAMETVGRSLGESIIRECDKKQRGLENCEVMGFIDRYNNSPVSNLPGPFQLSAEERKGDSPGTRVTIIRPKS